MYSATEKSSKFKLVRLWYDGDLNLNLPNRFDLTNYRDCITYKQNGTGSYCFFSLYSSSSFVPICLVWKQKMAYYRVTVPFIRKPVISRQIIPLAALYPPYKKSALQGCDIELRGGYAHAYDICTTFYCISIK